MNAYLLGIPPDYAFRFLYLIILLIPLPDSPFDKPAPITQTPVFVPDHMIQAPIKLDKIDSILTDDIISTKDGGVRWYLVHWSGRTDSDDSCITYDELQQLDLNLLESF